MQMLIGCCYWVDQDGTVHDLLGESIEAEYRADEERERAAVKCATAQ